MKLGKLTIADFIFLGVFIIISILLFHIFPSLTSSVLEGVKAQSETNIESAKQQKQQMKQNEVQNEEFESEMELARLDKENLKVARLQRQLDSAKLKRKLQQGSIKPSINEDNN